MFPNPHNPMTIRPNRLVYAAKVFIIEALVMPLPLLAMLYGNPILKPIGVLLIFLFGGGGICALLTIALRDWSIILTDAGIEMNGTNSYSRRALLRWEDIEKIEVITIQSVKMVGIRLLSYDGYLKSLDVEKVNFTKKIIIVLTSTMKFLKNIATTDEKTIALSKKLDAWNDVHEIRGLLEANRATCGYDISIGYLDRSPEKLADLLRASQEAAATKWRA